jgi:hypothetical protein
MCCAMRFCLEVYLSLVPAPDMMVSCSRCDEQHARLHRPLLEHREARGLHSPSPNVSRARRSQASRRGVFG